MATNRNTLDLLLDAFGNLQRQAGATRLRIFQADTDALVDHHKKKLAAINQKLGTARHAVHRHFKSLRLRILDNVLTLTKDDVGPIASSFQQQQYLRVRGEPIVVKLHPPLSKYKKRAKK